MAKGVYHINAVDCATQYEGVATCERISEAFLIPVLEALLQSFPFGILGFHSDNGSEYINRHVAELSTSCSSKSKPNHAPGTATITRRPNPKMAPSCANTWVTATSRNASRRSVNAFCRDYLNPYVNFHRPCLFAETITDAKGRQRKRYPYALMMTPYEKFKSLHSPEQFLKPGITFQQLDAQANAMSDNDAAQRLNDARAILFKTIFNRSKTAA